MRTKTPLRRTCNAIASKILRPPSLMNTCFRNMPRRQNKLSNASVASTVSIGDEFPNSMISFSYRWETSSSATFADTTNVDSEKPKDFKMVSTKAKRYELVLLYSHIRSSFHQPFTVPFNHKNSIIQ
ncbi:hypothetical protein V8G54_033184 [Vigna mungo]|uniref:Uncharacterized protein n=1 Tax=Vigna mungo TaxID=3915 RepID=A0AAQ3MMS3_VIGMU